MLAACMEEIMFYPQYPGHRCPDPSKWGGGGRLATILKAPRSFDVIQILVHSAMY